LILQGAYKSEKPGNLRDFCNSGKLREFEMLLREFLEPTTISDKKTVGQ